MSTYKQRWSRTCLLAIGLGMSLTGIWGDNAKANVCSSDPNNIVADCGFDNENASGGPVTITNPTTWVFNGDAGIDTTDPLSAANDAFLGNGTIKQGLSLIAGATYSLGFWLAADQTTINDANEYDLDALLGADCTSDPQCFDPSVTVSFDGQQLDQIFADDGNFGTAGAYVSFSYAPSASDSAGDLLFTGSQDPNPGYTGTWYIDEVQIDCTANCGAPTAVPEPPTLTLFLTACAFFGLSRLYPGHGRWTK